MTKTFYGIVHGKTIELEEDLGVAEGEVVEITLRRVSPKKDKPMGEGLLRTEGALADDPYWDAIMEEIYEERKKDTRREISE